MCYMDIRSFNRRQWWGREDTHIKSINEFGNIRIVIVIDALFGHS